MIDVIRGKFFAMDSMIRKAENLKNRTNYSLIALGSSHMEWGFIPQHGEINLGSASQDLYYSYNLYRIFNSDSVKNVFITFSVFTPNDACIKSGLAGITVTLKLLYGIDYQYKDIAEKKKLYKKEKLYKNAINKKLKKFVPEENFFGQAKYTNNSQPKNREEIHRRASGHYKINKKKSNQMDYCLKLINDTLRNGQRLYFVLPPAHRFYKEVLPSSEKLFEKLYEMCKNFSHVEIINLYDSNIFTDDDFSDGDHLNEMGAKKMTRIMRGVLNK